MSVDSTRDSGLGRINSVDDLVLPVTAPDSRMEEVMDDNSQYGACTSSTAHSDNDSGKNSLQIRLFFTNYFIIFCPVILQVNMFFFPVN